MLLDFSGGERSQKEPKTPRTESNLGPSGSLPFTLCQIHLVDIKSGENVCYNILDKIKYFNMLILCCSDIKLLI